MGNKVPAIRMTDAIMPLSINDFCSETSLGAGASSLAFIAFLKSAIEGALETWEAVSLSLLSEEEAEVCGSAILIVLFIKKKEKTR